MWNFLKQNRDSPSSTQDVGPYSNYRMAIRLELTQRIASFHREPWPWLTIVI